MKTERPLGPPFDHANLDGADRARFLALREHLFEKFRVVDDKDIVRNLVCFAMLQIHSRAMTGEGYKMFGVKLGDEFVERVDGWLR